MVTTIRKVTGGDHPFYEFACLSTDTKPTSLVPENSICHEIDTGKHFYCSNGEWKELPPKGGSGGGGLPADFPAEGSTNANKFLGFDANGDYTAKDAPSGGGAEKFIVTLTEDDGTWTVADGVTVADIVAADAANQVVVAKYPRDGMYVDLPLSSAVEYQGIYGALFIGFVNSGNDNKIVSVQCTNQGSGDVIATTEQPIPTSSSAPLIVTLTAGQEAGRFVGDKTNKEVYDALTAGQSVIMSAGVGSATFKLAVQYASFDGTDYEFAFIDSSAVKNTVSGGANDYVTASLA